MALTQVSSEGIKDAQVKTADILDGAVTSDKLGSNISYTSDMTWDSATNAGQDMKWDESESDLTFNDETYIQMGNSNDLAIGFNGTYSFVVPTGNNLKLGPASSHGTVMAKKTLFLQKEMMLGKEPNL